MPYVSVPALRKAPKKPTTLYQVLMPDQTPL